MSEIPLTQGKVAIVDDSDFEWLSKWRWYAQAPLKGHGTSWYAARRQNGVIIKMHQAIAGYSGADHVDGNGLNNQRHNLRPATNQENGQNQRKRAGTSSQYKGVNWSKLRGRWMASIGVNYRKLFLGRYDDETDAARAYDEAARAHFGKFANLNLP